jgi:hypothetical protein
MNSERVLLAFTPNRCPREENMRASITARAVPALRALWAATLLFAAASGGRASAEVQQSQPAGSALGQAPQSPAAPQQPAAELPRWGGERGNIGALLHIGDYSGFGAGVTAGTPAVGLRASAGWTPVLLFTTGNTSDLKLYSSLQISPDVYVRLFHPRPTTHVGLQGGYRYSTLLGHGLALGGYAQFGLSGAIDGLISAGLLVYPDGEDHLKRDENLPGGTEFSFPGPSVNFGVSLGLAFFP